MPRSSFAQYFEKGEYFERPILNKYEGTWIGTNGSDTLIIILEKIKYHNVALDIYQDLVGGWYKLIENGEVKFDYLDLTGSYENAPMPGFYNQADSTLQLSLINSEWWKPRLVSFKINADEQDQGLFEIYFSRELSAWLFMGNGKETNPISTPSTWIMNRIN